MRTLIYWKTDTLIYPLTCACLCVCWQGKQRVVRRESVVRVELAELSAELDLDVLSRLGSLSKAFSHCPTQTAGPGLMQVEPHIHLFPHKETNDI